MARHEFDGEKYAKVNSLQTNWGRRILDDLDFSGDERVLDLGCGDGALTAEIARRVPRGFVLGIDASEGMLRAAAVHAGGNCRFERVDINEMDYTGEFDVVFSNSTLHWVKDHARLLAAVRKALREGGRYRAGFAGDGNCRTFNRVVREAMALPEFAPRFERFEWPWFMPALEPYTKLVDAAGFREARVWVENADRHFENEAAMIGWIDQPSLVPFLPLLHPAERPAFRRRVVDGMIAAAREADGRCFETFRRVNVFAWK